MEKKKQVTSDIEFVALAWILANPIPSLTILGIVSFLVFRVAFLIYYNHFGITPEEVGLDYTDILTTQAAGGLLIILFCIGTGLFIRLKIAQSKSIMEQILSESDNEKTDNDEKRKLGSYKQYLEKMRSASQTALFLLIGIPTLYFIIVVISAIKAGDNAREPSVFNNFFQGRATPVVALWSMPSGGMGNPRQILYSDFGAKFSKAGEPSFLFLGANDGILILYDKHLGAIRLPRDKVLIISPILP